MSAAQPANAAQPMNVAQPGEILQRCRIVVCVGTGGVGKTTIAAALAVGAARAGQRALVLTIDPARRLADALGVDELDNAARELSDVTRQQLGIEGEGRLFAMMLDMKRTFDDLVERFAESPEARDRVLENRIYQHVSDALAGSGEYAAMEKVYEMAERDDFDVIVVDTPPSQHALDFLDAPQRLLEFLDSRLVQVLLHPAFAAGRFGFKLFQGATHRVFQLIERVSGIAFLEDISEFLLAFEGMSEGFKRRAGSVRELLLGDRSGFVLVAGASPEASRNAVSFLDRLESSGVPLVGIVLNRVRTWPESESPPEQLGTGEAATRGLQALAEALARDGSSPDEEHAREAARAAVETARGYASLVRLDARCAEPIRERAERSGRFFRRVPELSHDVHDLRSLAELEAHLF